MENYHVATNLKSGLYTLRSQEALENVPQIRLRDLSTRRLGPLIGNLSSFALSKPPEVARCLESRQFLSNERSKLVVL
jgi:hypothetical protein